MRSPNEPPLRLVKGLGYFASIGIGLLIIAGFGLRFYRPAADPPYWSYVYNTDEGHYSYNTHNKTKYGHWFVNEAKYALITPLFNLTQYLVAAALPHQPDIVRYRAVSILAGVLLCLALGFLFEPGLIAWTAVSLSSISFMAVVHSRIGIPEMTLTLLMLLTALLAIEGEKRRSFVLYAAAGFAAVAATAIKPTGVLILLVLVAIPALCPTMAGHRMKYFCGMAAGALCSGLPWLLIIVIPHYADWLKMASEATSFAIDSIKPDPFGLARSLALFFLSPALQTMPMLWPMALCWAILVFAPRLTNRENDFKETLLFLWLCFGIVVFGLTSYQPARWQLLILPPVIAAGLRFLSEIRTPTAIVAALVLAVSLSIAAPLVVSRAGLLTMGEEIQPGYGIFTHILTLSMVVSAFGLGVFAAKIFGMRWRTGILWGTVLLEVSVQFLLHGVYMKPSYSRPSQWVGCSRGLENLRRGKNDLFAGSMVQDLSLRADIRVLPTYYIINEKQLDDSAVRDFFRRQNETPDYFLLLDIEHPHWFEKAPLFTRRLERVAVCRLAIGGFTESHDLHIYRFRSYDWLR
jgi:hypothetical protein